MLLYVTKWVLARGILLVEGSVPERRGQSLNLYSSISGVGRRMTTVMLGSEAFYSLKDARENARERFKVRLKRARAEHLQAQQCWKKLKNGAPLAVHKKPRSVSKCGPFVAQKEKRKPTGRSARLP